LKAMIISQTVVTVFLINPDEVFGMHRNRNALTEAGHVWTEFSVITGTRLLVIGAGEQIAIVLNNCNSELF